MGSTGPVSAFVIYGGVIMTDEQIEKLIWNELKKRGVTFYDMIGLPNYGVDPNPEDQTTPRSLKCRSNRFNESFGSGRMKEILCVGEHNPYDEYPNRFSHTTKNNEGTSLAPSLIHNHYCKLIPVQIPQILHFCREQQVCH